MHYLSFYLPVSSEQKLITPRWHHKSVIRTEKHKEEEYDGIREENFEFESELTFTAEVQIGDKIKTLSSIRLDQVFDRVLSIISTKIEPSEAIITGLYNLCNTIPDGFEKDYSELTQKLQALRGLSYWLSNLLDIEEFGKTRHLDENK